MNGQSIERKVPLEQKDEYLVQKTLNARCRQEKSSVKLDPQIDLDSEFGCDFGLMVAEEV